jgi:hypothetical protein
MTSIYCPHCHKHTALSVAHAEYDSPSEWGGRSRGKVVAAWKAPNGHQWWIGICNGCGNPCLVCDGGFPIYPNPLPKPTDPHVPKDMAADLDEAKKCFAASCYRAAAVMARRVIQLACVQKGVTKSKLVDQITELSKLGIITKDIEEWVTVVRWIGNDAAHPSNNQEVTQEDAKDSLELAEQFLHILFVTPAIAKKRRELKGK